MLKVLVSGHRGQGIEAGLREALGTRPAHEHWLIAVVEMQGSWIIHVLVSPSARLEGWSWCGPVHRIVGAMRDAVREARLDGSGASALGPVAVAS